VNWRLLLTAVGVAMFGLSLLELAQPTASPLPANQALLPVLAGVLLVYVSILLNDLRRQPDLVETPDVELVTPPEVPGPDVEQTAAGFPATTDSDAAGIVQQTLRHAAVAVLTRYRGVDPETARQQVLAGSWTDDQRAADWLADTEPESSLRHRLRRLLSLGSRTDRARARTADAVAAVADVETDPTRRADEEPTFAAVSETGTRGRLPESNSGGQVRDEPRQTHHWAGVSVVVLVCLGLGVLLERPGVVLAGAVAVGYATYARAWPLGLVDLSVSRSVSTTSPDAGEEVTVTVTVTNEGGFCPDLRIVDGVPASLAVTEGVPRRAVALREGESVTFSYTVRARQGTHEFGPTQVVARNLSNSTEQELLVGPETTLTAVPSPRPIQESVPLRRQPTQYAGRAPTDSGGEGIEFHTVREYKPGDSMARIDWNRRARTGELTTLEFRRERATRAVLLVDVRPTARVSHDPGAPDAVERSIAATQRLFPALLAEGHQAGIAAFGPQECFLAPDTGTSHQQRGRDLLATDPAFNGDPDADETLHTWSLRFRQRLSDNTQLVLCSPLLDPRVVRVVRTLEAYGYPVTVLSPDPTATETPSQRLMGARRRLLVSELRQTGVPVLDWAPETPLEEVLSREAVTR
jgi:uncharacterized protein (DUF58 family)